MQSEAHILALKQVIAGMYKDPKCSLTTLIIDEGKTQKKITAFKLNVL